MLNECEEEEKKVKKINHEKEKELSRLPSPFGNDY